jgi:hypothetical protein
MKRLFWFLILVGALLLSAGPVLATSPAATIFKPGPIKNSDLPVNISIPGYYYLTENLTFYTGTSDAITVNSSDVTIDLMGFSIAGPGNVTPYVGINGGSMFGNIEVRNGTLIGWETGFKGLRYCRALNLRVRDCKNGISFNQDSLVKDCVCSGDYSGVGIHNNGVTTGNNVSSCLNGISATGTISNNSVQFCTGLGIAGGGATIIGNTVQLPTETGGTGIYTNSDTPCLVTQNTVFGTGTPYNLGGSTVSVNNAPAS